MKRHGGWIETYTGKVMYPLDPREDEIDIVDVYHSLSHLCRFTGHTSMFYSVGAHSCVCMFVAMRMGHSAKIQFMTLLHDASEAYLTDIPKPLKEFMPEYCVFEYNLMSVIFKKYIGEYTEEESRIVKNIDYLVLKNEAREFMKSGGTIWNDYSTNDFSEDILEIIRSMKNLEIEEVQKVFMENFLRLSRVVCLSSVY